MPKWGMKNGSGFYLSQILISTRKSGVPDFMKIDENMTSIVFMYMGPISKCEQICYTINGNASCTLNQKLFTDGRIDKHNWIQKIYLNYYKQMHKLMVP